jgi:ABC-type Fe3+ transport system substrate-binding protein
MPAIVPAARAARTITFAGMGEWFQAGFAANLLPLFRKTRPDLDVFYYPVATFAQTVALLRAGRTAPPFDLVMLDPVSAARAALEGLLETMAPASMPVLKDLYPDALTTDEHCPVMAWDTFALGFNPGMVPAAPRNWRDLWNGIYARIAVQTPPDPAGLALTQAASSVFGGTGDLNALNIGLTALTQLAPRITLWDPRPDIYTAITFGDAAIGPGWLGAGQAQARQYPGRFAMAIPDDGSPVRPFLLGAIKGAAQTEAGKVLAAWLLGQDAQRVMAETMFLAPVNQAASIPAPILARAGAAPAVVGRRMPTDWVKMMLIRDQLAAEWRRRKLFSG